MSKVYEQVLETFFLRLSQTSAFDTVSLAELKKLLGSGEIAKADQLVVILEKITQQEPT